jgi:hypothetical protein
MFPEVNGRQSFMSHSYTFHINKKVIQRIRLSTTTQVNFNYDNVFKEFVLQPRANINMIGQTFINFSYMAMNKERFRDVLFEGVNRATSMVETTPVKGLSISFVGSFGKYIYRSSTPELGRGYDLTTEVGFEPFSWLKASLSWQTARLNDIESGSEFYNGHIFRNVTSIQFTRKLFLRGITQYNTFSQSFSIYPLLNYKFNAFTMFCAGMTQDYMDYDQEEPYSFKTTGYQYFVKLQYLFSR